MTPAGDVRICDRDTNADLFWACRGGGGGNFGVVTRFVFRTHSGLAWFLLHRTWPWAAVEDVIERFQMGPPSPGTTRDDLQAQHRPSEPRIQVFGQYLGAESMLKPLLADLGRSPPLVMRTGDATWLDLQLRWAGCLGNPLSECRAFEPTRFAASSDYVAKRLPPRGIATMRDAIEADKGQAARSYSTRTGAL